MRHPFSVILVAEMEKAVLDYLYLNPKIAREADFDEWRFNSQEFLSTANIPKLYEYANAFNNESFRARVDGLLELMKKSK